MAAQDKVTFKQDLTEPVKIRHYEGVVFTGDDCGNLIKVALFDGGTPYSGGGTVSATAVLADGTTFPLTQGSITGNMVSVPLEAGALAVSGLMGLYVKISGGGIICTVLNAIFTVQVTDTGMVPAAIVTTVNELVAAIRDAQDSIPADLTNLLAAVAPTFSTTTAYNAGAYVWQGGKLYRFTAAHPAGTWTGTDAVTVALGNDVVDLKSAITKQSNKNLLNGYAPLSLASTTVYDFADNTMTIGTNTSGDSVITYAIFDLGLLADTYADTGVRITISGVVAEKMGTNVTIHSGVISSSGSFTRIANWVSSDITGEFSRTTTISADTLQTHTGKHIGVRIYGGYQVAVTLNSKTVFENLQIEIGSAATDYEPYLTAVDYTARKTISNEVTRIDALIDTEISDVEGQIDTAVTGIENELSGYIGRSLVNYGNIVTTELDLNGGDFVHPGTWTVNDVRYMPDNSPTDKKCRIVSFASQTNNSIYTLQLVADIDGNIYTRFSPNTTVWESDWYDWKANIAKKADEYPYNVQAFKPMWVDSELFVNNYTITHHGASEENKVSKMYALYDGMDSAASAAGITITKDNLGKDASNTFNIYNYKVSLNTGGKPVVLLIVGEHGDELNSAMLGYYAYREIIDGVLTKYLKYVDFWVVPLMNPWGYEHNTRNNSNDVNLNRDFPCEWQYSTSGHNKTGNTALSQPETNIIYNLIVNNQSKILFMCNKHDTGPIAGKIGTNQEDIVGYMSSYLDNDIIVNNGMAQIQNALVRQTDAWIIDNCSIDISNRQLIASRKVKTSGSMDLFANSIGVHGSLVEICNSAIGGDYPYYPSGAGHHADLARLGLNLFVNYLMTTIENNMDILKDNRLYGDLKYCSRKLVDGNYVDIELEWTGTELVEKT